jgi:hypothetical protein
MFRTEESKTANFRADYAKHADFCEVFLRDMKPLYLLAFLLTANHKQAERCFASTLEEAFKKQAVFKEWARSWVKRRPNRERDRDCVARISPNWQKTGFVERRSTRDT